MKFIQHLELDAKIVKKAPEGWGNMYIQGHCHTSLGKGRQFATYVNPETWASDPMCIMKDILYQIRKAM